MEDDSEWSSDQILWKTRAAPPDRRVVASETGLARCLEDCVAAEVAQRFGAGP
jgi:hypothetical protein